MFDWLTLKWEVPVNQFYKADLVSPVYASSENSEAKFRIKICPSGARKADYFSLFIISDSSETSFKCKISATILNNNGNKHYGLAANHTFHSDSSPFGWQSFIKLSDLMNREEGFINNECIQIWCVIGFIPEPQTRLVYVQPEEEQVAMDEGDCYFELGNDKFQVDGRVIAEKSEVIKKELMNCNNNTSHGHMIVKDFPTVSLFACQKLINYFHGEGNLDGVEIEVLKIADALEMSSLKELCDSKLAKKVVLANLKKYTDLAIKYNAELILERCHILRNQRDSKCHFVI